MVASDESESSSSARSARDSPLSEFSSLAIDEPAIIQVAAHGDLVLRISHETGTNQAVHHFRVGSSILKHKSKYFESLLGLGFREATVIEQKHKVLLERYPGFLDVPASELPLLSIEDIGRTGTVKAIDALLTDFFAILHAKDTSVSPPVANLANLAIVADRFDCLEAVKSYVQRKKVIRALDGKTTPKTDAALSEEKVRQRLLVAILLDYPPWTEKYSARLITKGWVGKDENADLTFALWWDLPLRIEEELAFRRACILETIQSLQTHFLTLYTARERQCKLFYDSSGQCDSFQLGEMVKFFMRVGTLQLQGSLTPDKKTSNNAYEGDLYALLDKLRRVPEYQIDRFHTHCGIRTRLVPLLDLVQECLGLVGICAE